MSTITLGGGSPGGGAGGAGGGRTFSGVLAGVVVDGVRVLDVAAAAERGAAVRGDVRRATAPLDRDINRMQQVRTNTLIYWDVAAAFRFNALTYALDGAVCTEFGNKLNDH